MEVSPLQSEKAYSPMLVTLLGMVMEVSPLQSEKAYSPMLVTPSPITYFVTWRPKILLNPSSVLSVETTELLLRVTVVRLEQPSKAYPPILSTLLGMVIDVRLRQE